MKRILLADDEVAILLAFKKMLEGPGVQVEAVDSTKKAQSSLKNRNCDVLLVDLRLQGTADMQGLKLVEYARKHKPSCFIVVFTAYGDEKIKSEAISAGADLFLIKPVSPTNLKKILLTRNLYTQL